MNIIRKIILYIKNLFVKQDRLEQIPEVTVVSLEDKKESFIESLKMNTKVKTTKKRIKTLICNGDGLGIQKKITY